MTVNMQGGTAMKIGFNEGCNMINRNASFRFTETVDKMKIYNNITERKVKE